MQTPESGAPGGPWNVQNERNDSGAVKQFNEIACVCACAEMLLNNSGITQIQIFEEAAVPTSVRFVAQALNHLDSRITVRWLGGMPQGQYETFDQTVEVIRRLSQKPWSAMMRWLGSPIGHNIVVRRLNDDGTLTIADPADGTVYEMTMQDFCASWGLQALWEIER